MAALEVAMRDYKLVYGVFPTGTYGQVITRLTGDNPRQIRFLYIEKHHVNAAGIYSDTWGTPFRIAVSNDVPVVSSAGPDRQFDTADDTVMSGSEPDHVMVRTPPSGVGHP